MAEGKSKQKSEKTSRASRPRTSAAGRSLPETETRPPASGGMQPEARLAVGKASPSSEDWRGETLAEIRRLIQAADPEIVEERKWIKPGNPAGVPTWSHAGIVCTGETYKAVVKVTFARGASVDDPEGLFNSSLEGSTRRAIDIREGESLNAEAFKALIRAAVAENLRSSAPRPRSPRKRAKNA